MLLVVNVERMKLAWGSIHTQESAEPSYVTESVSH
jgi:hypothetical protein